MDIATLLGIIGALGAIVTAILMGGDMSMFVNGPGLMIVVGGTFAVHFSIKRRTRVRS